MRLLTIERRGMPKNEAGVFRNDLSPAAISNEARMATQNRSSETGPWDASLAQIREWDPAWADACAKMTTNPWRSAVLPRKTVELISLAINAACTSLNPDGTRRHIRAALEAGATRDEILFVLKAGSLMSIH